jgi:hypothetical protein
MPDNNSKLHEDGSECENLVYFMATKPEPMRILKAIDMLCPLCSQRIREFLARDDEPT